MKNYLPLFLGFLLPALGFGQYELYNQGTLIYAQKDALVHVQGTYTNASASSTYTNNGILEVQGDLVNNGGTFAYDPSSTAASTNRAVAFVGNTISGNEQHIIGNWTTRGSQSIYNLVVSQGSNVDTVEMQADVLVEGSLVFGATNTTNSYTPDATELAVMTTANGATGLLKTYSGNSSSTFTPYLLNITNGRTDAIAGYPNMGMSWPTSANPKTGWVVTPGARYDGGPIPSEYTGLQRNDSLLGNTDPNAGADYHYDYPIGSVKHGYNALQLHMTSVPSMAALNIAAEFNDGTNRSDGFEGGITDEIVCSTCSANGTPGPPAAGQPSFNYYFTSDPCSQTGAPLWFILQQSTKNSGYWSIGSSVTNNYQYWLEAVMNNFTDDGSPLGTWRILQDKNSAYSSPGTTQYYYDPTSDDWTSQILGNILNNPMDLLHYSAYTSANNATNPLCYPLELSTSSNNFAVPGGIYSGGGHFASFRENENDALPVTLMYLTATPENNTYIQVAWGTSMEINNSGFEVQRSTDGINFTDIGWVQGNGTTTTPEYYSLNDSNVVANVVYYYQLRQVDYNGNYKLSNIASAELTGSNYFAVGNFIPNPATSSSKIIVSTGSPLTIGVKLYDVIGQDITASKSYDLTVGDNELDFTTLDLAAGNYTAVISAGNQIYTKKLVVVRQ